MHKLFDLLTGRQQRVQTWEIYLKKKERKADVLTCLQETSALSFGGKKRDTVW